MDPVAIPVADPTLSAIRTALRALADFHLCTQEPSGRFVPAYDAHAEAWSALFDANEWLTPAPADDGRLLEEQLH